MFTEKEACQMTNGAVYNRSKLSSQSIPQWLRDIRHAATSPSSPPPPHCILRSGSVHALTRRMQYMGSWSLPSHHTSSIWT